MIKTILLAALGLGLTSCGVYGSKGNDTGGIIPWSSDAERMALVTANDNCSMYGKYAVITSMRRNYGEYIVYECRFGRRLYEQRRVIITSKG